MDIPLSRNQNMSMDQIQSNCGLPHLFSVDEILREKSFSQRLLPFNRRKRRTPFSQIRCSSLEQGLQPRPKPKPSTIELNVGKEAQVNETQLRKPSSELCGQIEKLVFFKRYHEALELFEILELNGAYDMDSETYDALVSACIGLKSIRGVKKVFNYMINSGLDPDENLRNRVLLMHVKCGMMIDARRLFDEMPEKNILSWNTIIGGLVDAGDYFEAFRLFLMMWQDFSDAGSRMFVTMIRASAGLGLIFAGRQLHSCSLKTGVGGDVFVACALIDMYSKCGSIEDAQCVFDQMPEKTTVGWNSIIAGYALHGYSEEALSMYYEMRDSGVKIDNFTFSIIIRICARLASLEHAKQAHAGLVRHGFGLDIVANTALVDLYSKWGRIEDAKHVFDMMPHKNVISWNALIAGYGNHGRGVEAVEMFERMLHEGMVPNHVTFLAVLSACSYSGLSDRGWEIFESMSRDHKIKPRAMHYACMIELLGREGLLDEAFALIKDAPFKPTVNMWAALLTACRVHKNFELGKFAAEKLYGMGPEKLSNYVVLLNIYNRSGRLEEAAAVIQTLKRRGLRMLPACSWIEIKKQPYGFISGDKCHAQSKEIYQKLDELMLEISKHGYVPQDKFLLPDVDEQEERVLLYHSEKLAIAFGLITRPLTRRFHASPGLLARRRSDEPFGLKTPKREKYVKRESKMQPPVEAPYVHPKPKRTTKSLPDRTIDIFEGMTIGELAKHTNESISTLQEILVNVGEKFDSEFDTLSIDIAELVAMETGVNVRRLHSNEGAEIFPRPAVVTVMGHVDHGKTSLLDALRQTSVAAREAGGITQHLGAFVVSMPSGASITFLDTPGHAAFSAMRARGAAVTDVVVLVVAADDGVMPQTLEAMSHAKAAKVPIVVAINKCDKPAADPERVKVQLASEGLLLEEMGGDVQVVEVSAVNKTGLDNLEEALLLQADLMDLKARIDGPAQAYVVEARLDRGRGPLATAIVKAGTLVCGQHVVVGAEWGRIRAIRDMMGNLTDKAKPAMPVEIEGLRGLPMAGDDIIVVESEERARMLSAGRKKKYEKDRLRKIDEGRTEAPEPSEDVPERVEMPIIVKADVQGTVQAVTDALKSLNSPQVFVNVVHVGVGPISQSDVDLAQACHACIVGFNVKNPPTSLSQAASRASIKVKIHRVIYHLLEDIGNLIVDKAPGTFETQVAGEAQVLNIFELKGRSKSKGDDVKIAGCRVIDGRVTKSSTMRLLRSGEVMFEGSCVSLKREKQDVDTVGKGNECGLVIGDWDDFQIGDVIQCLEQVNRKPKFISSESGAVRIEC